MKQRINTLSRQIWLSTAMPVEKIPVAFFPPMGNFLIRTLLPLSEILAGNEPFFELKKLFIRPRLTDSG